MKLYEGRKRRGEWEVPEAYPYKMTFLPRILQHLGMYSDDEELIVILRNVPANEWSGKLQASLNAYDAASLLPLNCRAAVVFLQKSTT